jgi:hypothetical protein
VELLLLLWLVWLLMVVSEAVEPRAPLPVAPPPALRPADELPAPEFGYIVELEELDDEGAEEADESVVEPETLALEFVVEED